MSDLARQANEQIRRLREALESIRKDISILQDPRFDPTARLMVINIQQQVDAALAPATPPTNWTELLGVFDCPVAPNVRLDVMFRDGSQHHGCRADSWQWGEAGEKTIVAYRVTG